MKLKFFKIFRKEKSKIKMVQDEDLVPYLISLGVYQDILDRKIHCRFCGSVITLENLQALFPYEEKIYFVCSNVKCINEFQHEK